MALGKKTGGRRKGSKNKIPSDKGAAIERATSLAKLDRQGTSMGHIQIDAAHSARVVVTEPGRHRRSRRSGIVGEPAKRGMRFLQPRK